jgi:hypothetical protein
MCLVQTAYASHKKCIICYRLTSLHRIKPRSIAQAFLNHRIIIKNGTRCCRLHLDENGLIRSDEFYHIETRLREYNKQTINILDSVVALKNECGVFEKFKNIALLENDICIKITGWDRKVFMRFASFITSIKDSAGRTKEQLIALYRYWLLKGLDQKSLSLLNEKSSQQEISHYLSQIRVAIHNDFVPFFLGAKSKSRDLFLKHNNETTIELHNLGKNDLAIVADATYTRVEKSSNNDFQYRCWSQQKMDLLIKPFLICCADGYIIDCYGPFQANQNDATIFDYILETDSDLRLLLIPHHTIVFLDRGI